MGQRARHLLFPVLLAPALLVLTGCADLPPLDRSIDAAAKSAPYPELVATDRLLAGIEEPQVEASDDAELAARGDRLRARAAALRRRTSGG
ncbi:hypothetical protein [Pseudooceanicola sp.]|uniref:hypothetical protein n=1 Tax=Pseudooceanicola sp. TaxID=1914328 RepID=UPI0026391334|nr:hypothetical protein [Pseudooceanicola sp.]MDF1854857.1 hypothetical protein [Pseudooceanicola sp.]